MAAMAPLAGWSALALAQPHTPVIALFWIETSSPSPHLMPLLQGLREKGYVPDRNLRIDDRFLVKTYDDLAATAARLVAQKPDVVLVYGGTAVQALQRATATIPVVIAGSGDPGKLGVAKSLSRPGMNFTGLTILAADLSGKRLEFLKDAFPSIRRVAAPFYPQSASEVASVANLETAAREKNVELQKVEVGSAADIGAAIAGISRTATDAI